MPLPASFILLFLFGCALLFECASAKSNRPTTQHLPEVIVDIDADIDDLWAIAYLVKSGKVQIKAITVAGNGWCDPIFSVPAVMHTMEMLGCSPNLGPVAYGANLFTSMVDPSNGRGAVDPTLKLSIDRFLTTCLGEKINVDDQPSPYSAVELIIDILHKSPQPISILSLGTLTNIAQALIQDRSITSKIKAVYFSGGNYDGRAEVPASWPYVTKTKGSNWNIFADPLAAQRVFESGVEVIMMTSQAQDDLPVDPAVASQNGALYNVPSIWVDMVTKLAPCTNQPATNINYWDPSAAVLMVQHLENPDDVPICVEWHKNKSVVVLREGGMFGRTLVSSAGKEVTFCKHASLEDFLPTFWSSLSASESICPAPYSITDDASSVESLLEQIESLRISVSALKTQVSALKVQVRHLREEEIEDDDDDQD